ncbi:hypothetical protein C2G38_2220563 [Gigaspora rosea]|uniref:Sel1 repeat family protein n=1 Tax=Gigaspora rosea TaxID=44941 RepID=A0A397U7R4_9GLOM|nr:hypothetical protein C2G38_2220563 [Gigaspora rosea]
MLNEELLSDANNDNDLFPLYQVSTEIKDSDGRNEVVYCYQNGIGVKTDEQMRNINGRLALAIVIKMRISVEKDEYRAFNYYQESLICVMFMCPRNVSSWRYFYQNGIGVEEDNRKALMYYQKSADMENADGIFKYYVYFLNRYGDNIGSERIKALKDALCNNTKLKGLDLLDRKESESRRALVDAFARTSH